MPDTIIGAEEYAIGLPDKYIFSVEILQDQKRELVDKGLLIKIFESYQISGGTTPPQLEEKIQACKTDVATMKRNIRITLGEIFTTYAAMHQEDRQWCDEMVKRRNLLVDANPEDSIWNAQESKYSANPKFDGMFDAGILRKWWEKLTGFFK